MAKKKPTRPSPRRASKPYRSSKKKFDPRNVPLVVETQLRGAPDNARMIEMQDLYASLLAQLREYTAIHGNVQNINPEAADAPDIVKVHAVASEFIYTWDPGEQPQLTGVYTQAQATEAANVFISNHGTTLSEAEFGSLALLMRGRCFYPLAPYYSDFIGKNLPHNLMIW